MLKKDRTDDAAGEALAAVAQEARRAVRRRAALSAGLNFMPVPGLDAAADTAALLDMMRAVNEAFRLSPEQIGRLDTERRAATMRAVDMTGRSLRAACSRRGSFSWL